MSTSSLNFVNMGEAISLENVPCHGFPGEKTKVDTNIEPEESDKKGLYEKSPECDDEEQEFVIHLPELTCATDLELYIDGFPDPIWRASDCESPQIAMWNTYPSSLIPLPRTWSRDMNMDDCPESGVVRGELEPAREQHVNSCVELFNFNIDDASMSREEWELERDIKRRMGSSLASDDLVNSVSLENYCSVARMLFHLRQAAGCKQPHLFDEDIDFSKISRQKPNPLYLDVEPEVKSSEWTGNSSSLPLNVSEAEAQLVGTPSSGFSSGSSSASQ